jgi:hypothetical protein
MSARALAINCRLLMVFSELGDETAILSKFRNIFSLVHL